MKNNNLFFLIFLFSTLQLTAQTTTRPLAPPDLITLSGQTYHAARVSRAEPDGITYFFSGGVVKIPFTDLPEAIRKQYGYDPQKAAEFERADAAAQAESLRNIAASNAEAANRQREAALAAEKDLASAARRNLVTGQPSFPSSSSALSTGHVEGPEPDRASGSALSTGHVDGPEPDSASDTPTRAIRGQILSIVAKEDLILVEAAGPDVAGVVAIDHVPNIFRLSDDDYVDVKGSQAGTFEYDQVGGASATVRSYRFKSGNFHEPTGRKIQISE